MRASSFRLGLVLLALCGCTTEKTPGNKLDDSGTTTGPTPGATLDQRIDGAADGVVSDAVQLCQLSGGELVVAWVDDRDGEPGIFAATSADGGATWPDEPTRVSDAGAPAAEPAMTCSGPLAYIAWEDERDSEIEATNIYFAHSTPGGDGWSANVQLVGGEVNVFNRQGPAIAAQGSNVHVAWSTDENGAPDIYVASSTNQGGSFGPPVRVDGGLAGSAWSNHPVVHASATQVLVAWEDRRSGANDIWLARSTDGGASFGADFAMDPGTGDRYDPVIAAEGSQAYVLWHEQEPGMALEAWTAWSTDVGASFGAPVRLSEGVPGERDSILPRGVLVDGTLHTTWFQGLDGGYHILYKPVRDGAQAGGALRVDGAPAAAQAIYPSIHVEGDDVAIAWMDDRNAAVDDRDDLFYQHSSDGGATWAPADLRIDSHPDGKVPSADLSVHLAGGGLSAAWADARNGSFDVFFIHLALGDASD